MPPQALHRNRAVLKSAFGKDGHFEPGDRLDALAYNFSFELVEFVHLIIRQSDERDAFRQFNHIRPGEGAESLETKVMGGCISPRVRAAQPAGIRQ